MVYILSKYDDTHYHYGNRILCTQINSSQNKIVIQIMHITILFFIRLDTYLENILFM
jgi:hypothetical protein